MTRRPLPAYTGSMAWLYTSGILVRSVGGRVTGMKVAPGYRPPRDVSKYTAAYKPFAFTPNTWDAMDRATRIRLRQGWRASHVDIPGFERASVKFGIAIHNFYRRKLEALWASYDPHLLKGAQGPKGQPGKKSGKAPKSLDKPITDPAIPWWMSPPTFKAPCHAQKICDIAYQGLTDAMRNKWRAACTKLYRTPYDVYMHCNIPRILRGIPGPPEPPVRAGWKIRKLEQNPEYFLNTAPKPHWAYPDASCQTWGLSFVHVQFATRRYSPWPGEWHTDYATLYSLYPNVGFPDADEGFIKVTVYAGRAGDGQKKTIDQMNWPLMETNPIFTDFKVHSAKVEWTAARRDAQGGLVKPTAPATGRGCVVKYLTPSWAWGHYPLPYPSKKCITGNMSGDILEWPDWPGHTFKPYV